jgi:hypothetical protein
MLKDVDDTPEKLIRAFGNSVVYASHGGTHRAFGGYKRFAVTVGPMLGFQLPSNIPDFINDINNPDNLMQNLMDEGDISLGISPQVLNAHIGFNASFLLKNLYLGLRIGYFNLSGTMIEGLSFKNITAGLTANYQLVSPVNLSVITWRGVNIGSGIIYSSSKLNYSLPLDIEPQSLSDEYAHISVKIDPNVYLGMNISTFTIPIEAITAVKLLFINIPFGVGVDLAFGRSSLDFGIDADISFEVPSGISQKRGGEFFVSGGGKISPSLMNFKIMSGLGFAFGPVIIDIPVTCYFPNKGFNVGVTVGVVF